MTLLSQQVKEGQKETVFTQISPLSSLHHSPLSKNKTATSAKIIKRYTAKICREKLIHYKKVSLKI